MADLVDRYRGCLLGLAAGDAIGTAVEFRPRGSFAPVTDMTGGGPARDQMDRYCRWSKDGYLSSTGKCFDIGNTVSAALRKFLRTSDPFAGSEDPRSAGNGSIMRLAPVPMFFHPDVDAVEAQSGASSRTTHGTLECVDACRLLGRVLGRAFHGRSKHDVAFADGGSFSGAEKIVDIARGTYADKPEQAIRGSGYVVESLEAALWCFVNTDTFEAAILRATNLGDDADTTAAVCGQIAGAFYGASSIPLHWRQRLAFETEITALADRLAARVPAETG
jgi:ADP-ribosyl-[dinitrogen reductase] hydrolase